MIEVYRETVIIVADNLEGLINHHDWLLGSVRIHNQKYCPNGEGRIEIGPLSSPQEDPVNYKELIHKETWKEKTYEEFYKNRIRGDNVINQKATYEFKAYDKECVWSDKSGVGYKEGFYDFIDYKDYPEEGAVVMQKEKDKMQNLVQSWKMDQGSDWIKIGLHNMNEPSKEELQAFKEKTNHEKQLEIKKNLRSWKQ